MDPTDTPWDDSVLSVQSALILADAYREVQLEEFNVALIERSEIKVNNNGKLHDP